MAAAGRVATSLVTKTTGLAKASVDFAKPRLNTFWRYARVELAPPTPAEFPAVQQGFQNLIKSAQTGKWRNVTIKQATVNTLVTLEVLCWFVIGEILGKRALVGYQVPGATHFDAEI